MEMTPEFKARLEAVAEKVKAKGYESCHIDFGAGVLSIFKEPPANYLTFTASIRCGSPTNYVKGWTFDTAEEALAALERTANEMPQFKDEQRMKVEALAKLSPEERRLLKVYEHAL